MAVFIRQGTILQIHYFPKNPISVYTRTIQKIVPFRIRPVKLLASSKLTAPLQLTHIATCAMLRDQFELLRGSGASF
jgi:hypothetical protein